VSAQKEAAAQAAGEAGRVQRAFRLGWHFAQMYHDPHQAGPDAGKPPAGPPRHLPSLGELTVPERATLLMRKISNDVTCLNDELPDDLKVERVVTSVATLSGVMSGRGSVKDKQLQILAAYTALRIDVGAADVHAGTALDLGRMLADTVLLSASVADYKKEFGRFRLGNAYGWLEDLHTYFPLYAADAIKGSLEIWQGWVDQHAEQIAGDQAERVKRALGQQGEKWRRILSGEILAEDLLTSDDYREAASFFLGRLRGLIWTFLKRFWPIVIAIVVVAAAIIAVIIRYAPHGPASVAALIAASAGTLGVSWTTVSSTLGKVASNAEQPLWRAEVLEAIVMAATVFPSNVTTNEARSLRRSVRRLQLQPGRAQPGSTPAGAAGEHADTTDTPPPATG
jgi:hypothetical protein